MAKHFSRSAVIGSINGLSFLGSERYSFRSNAIDRFFLTPSEISWVVCTLYIRFAQRLQIRISAYRSFSRCIRFDGFENWCQFPSQQNLFPKPHLNMMISAVIADWILCFVSCIKFWITLLNWFPQKSLCPRQKAGSLNRRSFLAPFAQTKSVLKALKMSYSCNEFSQWLWLTCTHADLHTLGDPDQSWFLPEPRPQLFRLMLGRSGW